MRGEAELITTRLIVSGAGGNVGVFVSRYRKILTGVACGLVASLALRGQEAAALNPPVPLLRMATGTSAGTNAVALAAAQRAQDLGLPLIAVDIYREVREEPGEDRAAITLLLVTALLDAGRAEDAVKMLEESTGPHNAAWHLRAALAALQLRKRETAQAELDLIKSDDVAPADRAWYWFLTGALYDTVAVRDGAAIAKANEFYSKAEAAATTGLAKARFQLAAERVRLRPPGVPKEADLKPARDNYERFQGTQLGYDFAKSYAVMLDALSRKGEAVTFLQGVLVPIQRRERDAWDTLRLVLGVIGDKSRNGAGRRALTELVESGNNAERQRQALQLLAAESGAEPERGLLRGLLKKLIEAKPEHPIKESLLFYRAQLALAEKDFAQAEEDANALLKQFPRSPLRVHALGVLTHSAWEQRRFRLAADYAQRSRAELGPGGTATGGTPTNSAWARTELGVLEAEARFRAGLAAGDRNDFRLAADAYAAVLKDRPPGFEPAKVGALMYQRVLAEIKSGSGDAGKVIDDLVSDNAFDLENRWQAEWSLARALQLQGEAGVKEAYARVNNLLREPIPGTSSLRPELRARVAWLQARLAFDSNEAEQAIKFAEALPGVSAEIEAGLRTEIASTAILLKARAELALGREPVALETLKVLREKYPMTDAAISSYLIESEHYALQDKIDEARNRLIGLTDNASYKNSEYVPYALFRLALLSERLGRPENLQEANKRIEDLIELVTKAPAAGQTDLVFAARLKQGDIFRKLNDFPAAQRAYEDLVNKYGRRPDVVLAQLALAETHNAQSSADAPQTQIHADAAQLIFEQLRDRVDAPRDVRVEAGYNLGKLLERRGKPDAAARVWWQDVVNPFLVEETRPFESDAKRPYWLARTLRELGDLLERQGRIEEAKAAYKLLLEKRLPYGEAVARARLAQFGIQPAKPTP